MATPAFIPTEVIDFEAIAAKLGLQNPTYYASEETQLWGHQLVTLHKAKKRKRCILGLDKGMGKTLTVLSIFEDPEVHKDTPGFTVLILCPEKGMGSYIRDIQKFPEHADKIQLVYGNKGERKQRWKNSRAKYFICTYASFLSDIGYRTNNKKSGEQAEAIAPKWVINNQIDGVVFDEYHRQFRRHTSKAFDAFCKLFRHTEYLYPMSGSVLSKGPQDAWAALHLVDPKLWSSYWKYVYTWCEVEDGMFGKVVGGPRLDRVKQWQAAVADDLIYITAEMVSKMPPKQRDLLDVHMELWQRKLHNNLRDNLYAETEDGDFLFAENALTKIHKLRMALICPTALHPSYGVGQGIQDIRDDALDGGIDRYAIFTPFKAPIPHLETWLRAQGVNVWTLQGGIGLDEQTRRINAWRASLGTATPENPSVLLSTIKYAESWEIPEARYGYLLGYEWDPEDNKQAEDRLRRLVSVGMTYIRYVRHKGAYDEDLLNLIVEKNINVSSMFKDWGQFKRILAQPKRD